MCRIAGLFVLRMRMVDLAGSYHPVGFILWLDVEVARDD